MKYRSTCSRGNPQPQLGRDSWWIMRPSVMLIMLLLAHIQQQTRSFSFPWVRRVGSVRSISSSSSSSSRGEVTTLDSAKAAAVISVLSVILGFGASSFAAEGANLGENSKVCLRCTTPRTDLCLTNKLMYALP